ncbi:glycosyltransferase family 2 protein [Methylobacterium radiodurans]|uniref:Glycosyltransferase family 2 protein n=1 Tax=Methylobacterium radiodurans TaxID=2202828 RepID=A0A2U8VLZ9_9HYPH|nr:glycosyltransferase family 2 protein [Methylobacterium radiodurans]AWN34432.1 glycosyltransferase family 2 protein [Methylobacterium radiodurans]
MKIAIITPSRLKLSTLAGDEGSGVYFLEHAVRSAEAQQLDRPVELRFFVGVDPGTEIPARLAEHPLLTFVHSDRRTQVAALNAALQAVDDSWDLVGFLEDDDRWLPQYLSVAIPALDSFDFVSSTQLEVDESGEAVRINDFPTPSGWLMRRSTHARVGDVSMWSKWHYDNEWLGRLAETGLRRGHLVEATAPASLRDAQQVRPWLANVLSLGGPNSHLVRHGYVLPLVRRLVHPGSGTSAVGQGSTAKQESDAEYQGLVDRFGHIPW